MKAADADGRDAAFRAASQHAVGQPGPDVHDRVANRHRRRCTRGARRGQRAARAELHRHVAGAHVGDDPRRPERREALDASLEVVLVRGLLHIHAADTTGDRGADAVALSMNIEARGLHGLAGRAHGEVDVAARAAGRLALHDGLGVEALHLAADLDRAVGNVEARDQRAAGLALAQRDVKVGNAVRNGVHRPHARDHNAAHGYIPSPPSTDSTAPVMNEASSESRKRTVRAMSSGSPRRPSGVWPSRTSRISSLSTSVSSVEM